MDKFKEILGEELFNQVNEKIEAHNKDEANKDNQIKLANLSKGDYVGKGKFDSLQEAMNGKEAEIVQLKNMLDELKKASKGNEDLQAKFKQYEQENADLHQKLEEAKINYVVDVKLMESGVKDENMRKFLKFQLNSDEDGKALEIDEEENVKGWEEKLSGLKTQFPNMFESSNRLEDKKIEERKLNGDDSAKSLTRTDILKKPYAERIAIYENNPEAYNEAMKN